MTASSAYDCLLEMHGLIVYQVEMGDDSGNILTCPQCGKQTCKYLKLHLLVNFMK